MSESPQLDRPGVEIIQQFVTTNPTILRPSLQACVVGVCKQVVEAVTDDGSLDSKSLVQTPARLTAPFVSDPFEYTGIGGVSLFLSVNRAPAVEIEFTGTDLTAAEIVDQIQTEQVAGLLAYVETSGEQQRVVLQTTSKGDNAALTVGTNTNGAVLAGLGLTAGQTTNGSSGYDNAQRTRIQASDYPNPRGNLQDLKVDHDSIRVFVSSGGTSPREVSRHESLLQGKTSDVSVYDDGDGDSLSPYLDFDSANFAAAKTKAHAEGTADLSAITYASAVQGRVLRMSIDGDPYQTLVFANTVTDQTTLLAAINGLWGAGVATSSGGHLVLNSPAGQGGEESSIRIDKDASTAGLLTALGLTGANTPFNSTSLVQGNPYPPHVGDEVWVDGLRLGLIVEVPASPNNRLRLDTERLLTFEGSTWSIVAKGLDNSPASSQRPSSELQVDVNTGTILIKPGLFRDTAGVPTTAKGLGLYLAYDALRRDVTPAKTISDFNLLRVGQLDELQSWLSPIDTQNPLGLGLYFAMLNAPGLEVTGCGVDEASDGAPEGTAEAYARAFEFLESKDVYAIAPLTHSADVGQIAYTHATVMSEPQNGLERVVILNPNRPRRKSPTLIASGARANVSGTPSDNVQTGLADLQARLAAAGKPGPAYTESEGLYVMFEGSSDHYLIQGVSSGVVTINNGPLSSNADGFYVEGGGQPVFTDIVVDRPFTIAIRGGLVGSSRTDEAAAYADIGRGYKNRRVIVTVPEQAKASVDGLEQIVEGYYLASALAGRKSSKAPADPLTEDTLTGFTGVIGSQERYSEPQLRILGGGGLWVFYQEAEGQPIRTRHQLTTDVSTLQKRESSITDALDYGAKVLRQTFRNFIGRYNITTGLLEALNVVCDGVRDFFLQNNIYKNFTVVELLQNQGDGDELSAIVDIETFKPANKIRVTMRIT